jgi:hypothetical protein
MRTTSPSATVREPFPANGSGFLGSDRFVGASPNPADLRKVHMYFKDALDMETSNVSATLNWDIAPGVTLSSITAYQELYWNQATDGDGTLEDLKLVLGSDWLGH